MNKDGQVQSFYRYTGKGEFRSYGYITEFEDALQMGESSLLDFIMGRTFDNRDYVVYDGMFLFPSGYFCKTSDMIYLAESTGLMMNVAETLEDKDRAMTIKQVDNHDAK